WVWTIDEDGKGHFNITIAPSEYRKAFESHGLVLDTLDAAEAAKRISASDVKTEITAALDDWAVYEPKDVLRGRLLEIARAVDKGDWTDRLRNPTIWKDKTALEKLAAEADPLTISPAALIVLVELMNRNQLNSIPLLTVARTKHPTNF